MYTKMRFLTYVAISQLLKLVPLGKADECAPHTWVEDNHDTEDMATPTRRSWPIITPSVVKNPGQEVKQGDVVCRSWGDTDEEVNGNTCAEFADFYWIDVERFFELNPMVKNDCSNLRPHTEYCTDGWIEPLRNKDGRCGPPFGNASCAYSNLPCCNSETWKCGDTWEDCEDGTCYEGLCPGHAVYTTDGKCGLAHGIRQCAGKWGDCCSLDGECGTGPDFCGLGKCQLGNCVLPESWFQEDKTRSPSFSFDTELNAAFEDAAVTMTTQTSEASASSTASSTAFAAGTCEAREQGVADRFLGICFR